jgi:hypothetical protein
VAKTTVSGIFSQQGLKGFCTDMYQLLVITGLEVDICLLGEQVIHHRFHPVGRTHCRKRAYLTVPEEAAQLTLGCQPEITIQLPVQLAKVNLPV